MGIPEPFTFSELYDLRVAATRQVKEAEKNLQRLRNSGGRTAATTHAIERWAKTHSTYSDLADRVQAFIEVKLAENDEPAPRDLGNKIAQEGCDRCFCGCKYWENDRCIDCGTHINQVPQEGKS
jgi:hypothetical protein